MISDTPLCEFLNLTNKDITLKRRDGKEFVFKSAGWAAIACFGPTTRTEPNFTGFPCESIAGHQLDEIYVMTKEGHQMKQETWQNKILIVDADLAQFIRDRRIYNKLTVKDVVSYKEDKEGYGLFKIWF